MQLLDQILPLGSSKTMFPWVSTVGPLCMIYNKLISAESGFPKYTYVFVCVFVIVVGFSVLSSM